MTAKIVFSCGVGIGARLGFLGIGVRLGFLGRRDAYPTDMYLHNWDAPS